MSCSWIPAWAVRAILSSSYPVKMEMGFPPAKQAALVGHGSEYQLQRDFLAMAIAVYDELPSWYEFVGGRYFNEYVKPRRIYYEAKLYPQGMSCYAPHRFGGDCCGAALIQAATGVSPYSEDMARVIFSFVSNERTLTKQELSDETKKIADAFEAFGLTVKA